MPEEPAAVTDTLRTARNGVHTAPTASTPARALEIKEFLSMDPMRMLIQSFSIPVGSFAIHPWIRTRQLCTARKGHFAIFRTKKRGLLRSMSGDEKGGALKKDCIADHRILSWGTETETDSEQEHSIGLKRQ